MALLKRQARRFCDPCDLCGPAYRVCSQCRVRGRLMPVRGYFAGREAQLRPGSDILEQQPLFLLAGAFASIIQLVSGVLRHSRILVATVASPSCHEFWPKKACSLCKSWLILPGVLLASVHAGDTTLPNLRISRTLHLWLRKKCCATWRLCCQTLFVFSMGTLMFRAIRLRLFLQIPVVLTASYTQSLQLRTT